MEDFDTLAVLVELSNCVWVSISIVAQHIFRQDSDSLIVLRQFPSILCCGSNIALGSVQTNCLWRQMSFVVDSSLITVTVLGLILAIRACSS